jgi:hypothetical protein
MNLGKNQGKPRRTILSSRRPMWWSRKRERKAFGEIGSNSSFDGLKAPMSDELKPDVALLKEQFDLVLQDPNVASDMFDAHFQNRFAELMKLILERNSKTGYIDWSRR